MVRKEDRGEGKFDTLTKCLRLASHTINITDNPKVFTPEHGRLTEEIRFLAKDIYHKARVANDIRVTSAEEAELRKKLQNQAIAECDHLLSEIQIAMKIFHLRVKRVEYWGNMVEEVKNYLRSWRDKDADRYRQKLKR